MPATTTAPAAGAPRPAGPAQLPAPGRVCPSRAGDGSSAVLGPGEIGSGLRGSADGGLRERLLARVHTATAKAWAGQEAELAAENAALGWGEPPSLAELAGLDDDPGAGPPDGEDGWLGDLPGPLLEEYLAAVAEPERPEPIQAGFWDRATGDGAGFASGGVADELPPGAALAGLAGRAWDGGLGRLSDDELVGVLRAARRLSSWAAALELSAVADLLRRRKPKPRRPAMGGRPSGCPRRWPRR